MIKLFKKSIQRTYLYEHCLSDIPFIQIKNNLSLDILVLDSLNSFISLTKTDSSNCALYEKRFLNNDICFVACHNDVLLHYSWVQHKNIHYIKSAGHNYPIKAGEFVIYHCSTVKEARGIHIYPYVLTHILRTMSKSKRHNNALIYTTTNNVPSIKGITRSGFILKHVFFSLNLKYTYFPLYKYAR